MKVSLLGCARIISILVPMMFLAMIGSSAYGECREERTMGADYYQARTNCEAILRGDAYDCQYGGNVWYCSCDVGCSGGGRDDRGSCREERTIGADYYQAKTNCELILHGEAYNCKYGGNIWYCSCDINCR